MPPAYQTSLTVPRSLPTLDPSRIHLLPFHLTYTGPADVDVYFVPRHEEDGEEGSGEVRSEEQGVTGRTAAFRGRQVVEQRVQVPRGYKGCLVRAPGKPTGRTEDVVANGGQEGDLEGERVGERASEARSLRKRKVAPRSESGQGQRSVQTRTKRKAVSSARFALDSEEEEDGEEERDTGRDDEVPPRDVDPDAGKMDGQSEGGLDVEGEKAQERTGGASTQSLEHMDSIAVVDTMVDTVPSASLESKSSRGSLAQDNPPQDDPHDLAPNDNDADADNGIPSAWIHERKILATATFSGINIWTADEAMYSVRAGVGAGEEAGEEVAEGKETRDVVRLMGERDEYVRALDEGRRVAEVVHGW